MTAEPDMDAAHYLQLLLHRPAQSTMVAVEAGILDMHYMKTARGAARAMEASLVLECHEEVCRPEVSRKPRLRVLVAAFAHLSARSGWLEDG